MLYEGYILYPYRPSVKNQQRWTFGGLYPRAYSEAHDGSDAWRMQVECVLRGDARTVLRVHIRFLHLIARRIIDAGGALVDSLHTDERVYHTWQEATEREVALEPWQPASPCKHLLTFDASESWEAIHDRAGNYRGAILREQQALAVSIRLSVQPVDGGFLKVRMQIENRTPLPESAFGSRDDALLRSLASTHAILQVEDGEFISLLDPPNEAREATDSCVNIGAWPVLVGAEGEHDGMLAAPIILYDYPQIATASPGDLFDGTEIDEILSLRILTLSDEEKRQAVGLDEQVRALLTRTETLDRRQFAAMHGVMHATEKTP